MQRNHYGSKNKNEDLVVVFDIGSGSVGGALVLIPKKKESSDVFLNSPKILYSTRLPITLFKNLEASSFLIATNQALNLVCLDLIKEKKEIFLGDVFKGENKIICFLASPWQASQTRIVSFSKTSEFEFTEKIWNELLGKEYKKFEKEFTQDESKKDSLVNFESKTMQVKLNGYPVSSPLGLKTKSVEFSFFMSLTEKKVLESFKETIGRSFNIKNLEFSSFLFSSFVTTRDLFSKEEDFILIDVGSEVTEMAIVKNGVLLESFSYPVGKNHLIRSVSKKILKDFKETTSLFSIYLENHLETGLKREIDLILEEEKVFWIKGFQSVLKNFSNNLSIPNKIILSLDEDVSMFYKKIIESEEWSQYMLPEKSFNVIILENMILRGSCLDYSESQNKYDPFLMIESLFINKIF